MPYTSYPPAHGQEASHFQRAQEDQQPAKLQHQARYLPHHLYHAQTDHLGTKLQTPTTNPQTAESQIPLIPCVHSITFIARFLSLPIPPTHRRHNLL
jgi:hypothetical protein